VDKSGLQGPTNKDYSFDFRGEKSANHAKASYLSLLIPTTTSSLPAFF